jgi:hypothetical protein
LRDYKNDPKFNKIRHILRRKRGSYFKPQKHPFLENEGSENTPFFILQGIPHEIRGAKKVELIEETPKCGSPEGYRFRFFQRGPHEIRVFPVFDKKTPFLALFWTYF